ncbi:MAG: Rieske 2Fe-2S domain-containing protein [Caldilinea sp.]
MSEHVSRRNFLKLTWGVAGAVALAESGAVAYMFLSPRTVEGEFGGVFTAGPLESFPTGSVTPFTSGRFYLVREDDGGFVALYRKCTHLGCAVPWEPAQGRFVCPCHASAFERNGGLVNAPAPRPLDRFAVTIVEGVVMVDTGRPIQRDHALESDLVYA